MVAEVYFKTLDEKGRVFLFDKSFLEQFIMECRDRNIPVRTFKRKGYYEVIRGWLNEVHTTSFKYVG